MADRDDRSVPPGAEGLGEGVPANVDLTKLGQRDNPQEDWGEPADEGVQHGASHVRRQTAGDRLQGGKTRRANKDIVSRRS
ncbi:MAG: hypothetical protein GC203_04505 [Phenylobacterium sp.]|uniref:hypothetical protein n=1 Tax=Phenylobacterium sp. TaxID=1871053 RepID=UPI0025F955A6|nr:hypothetical protein [Phenylobacterium sp.]MBI1197105.1 hypothetical protein [Phenylobacterium sp.]